MITLDPVRNNSTFTVAGFDAVATSVIIGSGDLANLPDPVVDGQYNLSVVNITDFPNYNDPNYEIVRATAKTGTGLTIVRAQEGTSASAHNIAGKVYQMVLSPTKKTIDDCRANFAETLADVNGLQTQINNAASIFVTLTLVAATSGGQVYSIAGLTTGSKVILQWAGNDPATNSPFGTLCYSGLGAGTITVYSTSSEGTDKTFTLTVINI